MFLLVLPLLLLLCCMRFRRRLETLVYYCMVALARGKPYFLILATRIESSLGFLIPFAAGNFIYIAGSDLIPELNKYEFTTKGSFLQLATIILGIGVMMALLIWE